MSSYRFQELKWAWVDKIVNLMWQMLKLKLRIKSCYKKLQCDFAESKVNVKNKG